MEKKAMEKIYYRIVFRLASALSVGSGENRYSDGDVIRDSAGEPFIPGSSLAGVYRTLLKPEDAEYYFGASKDGGRGMESRVLVYDAKLRNTGKEIPYRSVIRDCVALDEWKTGKAGHKFDFETVEPGAEFVTYLEQNAEAGEKDVGQVLAEAWRKHRIHMGRRTMRGLGSIGETSICRRSFDLGKQDQLDAWLDFDMYREEDWKGKELQETEDAEGNEEKNIVVEFALKQKGGISVRRYTAKVKEEGVQPDAEQLTCVMGKDGQEAPYIPGSSWAGAFRHHMERLVPGCTEKYFGSCEKRSVVCFGESFLQGALPKVLTRNAVDRFTGGVIENALFTEKMWYGGEAVLHIEIPADTDLGFRQALAASLTDLHMGLLSVGGLTAVGRGVFEGKGLWIDGASVSVSEKMYGDILEKLEGR